MTEVFLADLSTVPVFVPEIDLTISEEVRIAVILSSLGKLNKDDLPLPDKFVSVRRVESIPRVPVEIARLERIRRNQFPHVAPLNQVGLTEYAAYALNSNNRKRVAEYLPYRVLRQYRDAAQLVAFHGFEFRFRDYEGPIVFVGRIVEEDKSVIHDYLLAAWTPFENLACTFKLLGIKNVEIPSVCK